MRRQIILTALVALAAVSASARNLYIPVGGKTAGANNTSFRTDVRLFNPSFTKDVPVTLHWLPQGLDGSNIPGRVVSVPHRQMVVLNDVVGGFFQVAAPAVGAIRIDSNEQYDFALIATSRTYTNTPDSSGTFGQFIPALDESQAVQKSIVLHVTHSLDFSTGYRTNAGIMNPTRQPVVVTPSVAGPDGTLIAEGAAITVPPHSMIQLPLTTLMGVERAVENGFIYFDSTGPVFTYASVVDNRTGDQFFVAGQKDDAEVKPLPQP